MFHKSWIDQILSRPSGVGQGRRCGRQAARTPRRQRLSIETLEDRCVPSAVTVTTYTDVTDGNSSSIAALLGSPGPDGAISMREAILASNNTPGANSIGFASALAGKPILLTQGELFIGNAVTITGLGPANTTLDAQHNSRIFDITSAAGAVTLDGLKLINGQVTAEDGGAIKSQSSAMLTVNNSVVSGNTATGSFNGSYYTGDGGGIFAAGAVAVRGSTITNNLCERGGGIFAAGDVTVSNSSISGNTADGRRSGGIFASGAVTLSDNSSVSDNTGDGISAGAGASVTNSTIADNFAGSGLEVYGDLTVSNSTISDNVEGIAGIVVGAANTISITNSTISGNYGGDAGGILCYELTPVVLSNCTLSNNSTGSAGGAINAQSFVIKNCTISGNRAYWAGGIAGNGTISGSTISGNQAISYSGGIGGGDLTISNSTICGNSAFGGGGIDSSGDLSISNSTISGNSAGFGGGVIDLYGSVTVRSSIVAGNSVDFGPADLGAAAPGPGTITVSNSLIGNNAGSHLSEAPVGAPPDANGNFIGGPVHGVIDPLLGPLANNGGPTQTMALLPGSPAIDHGANPDNLTSDQRGLPYVRTSGRQTDMGAFELQTLTAQQLTALIVNQVNTLISAGSLSSGNSNALTSKLNSGIASFNAGHTTAGTNQLNAFINQVTAFQNNGTLTSDQAQTLVSNATLAINTANGGSGAHLMNQDASADPSAADMQPVNDAGQLVTGTIGVYLDNADGTPVPADEQARFDDALSDLNATFGAYGVHLVDVGLSDTAEAIVQVEIAGTSAAGSAADGVLGCTLAGQITLVTGWNWYTGADPSAIGAGQYDFQTIVTHELGHAIGLGHSGDQGSVMYPYLAAGEARHGVTARDMSVLEASDGAPEPLLASPGHKQTVSSASPVGNVVAINYPEISALAAWSTFAPRNSNGSTQLDGAGPCSFTPADSCATLTKESAPHSSSVIGHGANTHRDRLFADLATNGAEVLSLAEMIAGLTTHS
jgi:hypothetical protein